LALAGRLIAAKRNAMNDYATACPGKASARANMAGVSENPTSI
jgi:hypothetical protein